jgi:periplasmic divalent cation tolerance protein
MPDSNPFKCALVTAPTLTVARKLAAAALNQRLVACVNLIPKVESHYWWQGNIESSSEVLMIFKTAAERIPALEECVLQNHPYETPEFIVLEINAGNQKYLDWIGASIRAAS